ncbi:hypothetical protein M501DRAFT_924948 [Patellaria atrata CBS 101060]|uniref:Zn(2)-C6 fungal-type domain-containing protein n=1 Tax=Patellaria atrata CBS 101060 TaxID=1346257 RepID=A0A9P4SJ78_9PEZI|nr:hypothetical protein M501DRAFT_924948 [Patellaria atrata CBS 101060]
MPRPKKEGAGEPKKRSRNGCWPCKGRKVKCGEEKPTCLNCERQGETCDYSIRLNWGGRTKKKPEDQLGSAGGTKSLLNSPHEATFSFNEPLPDPPAIPSYPQVQNQTFPPRPGLHGRSLSSPVFSSQEHFHIDPDLMRLGQNNAQQPLSSRPANPTSAPVDTRLQNVQHRGVLDYPSPAESNMDRANFGNGASKLRSSTSPTAMPPPRAPGTAEGPSLNHSPLPGPMTPGSSIASDEQASRHTLASLGNSKHISADVRRLSVVSLLSSPTNDPHFDATIPTRRQYPISDKGGATIYGYDNGHSDMDTPQNDDLNAITVFSPVASHSVMVGETHHGNNEVDTHRTRDIAFQGDGYYAKPVPVRIPKSLEPLPARLLEKPMNLLYFHHFLNHTARILVPHDCASNPFRSTFPLMAVQDEDLLHLMLAYSAIHRAHLLGHPKPSNRIAVWVEEVFPRLRQVLAGNPDKITNANLTTAIMLASLEIISPNAFEVSISWQNHLTIARQMILARGGPLALKRSDKNSAFLGRWFAYLDVVGLLSGNKLDPTLHADYSSEEAFSDDDYQIDCLLGFTNRCGKILAKVGRLVKLCESARIDQHGHVREGWTPRRDIAEVAEKLRAELQKGRERDYKGCTHGSPKDSEAEAAWDSREIHSTNEAFHWAGLIHLDRRVLGKQSDDPEVQEAVRKIVAALYRIREGSTAEACLLFPMFAAGCDAIDLAQREKITARLKGVEGFGMNQIVKARTLLQKVWETGESWESLSSEDFFG